jgi:hypothetical protein
LYLIELAFDWKIRLIGVGLAGKVNGADAIQCDALAPILTAPADIAGKAETAIAVNLRDKSVDATIVALVRSHRDREGRLGRTGFAGNIHLAVRRAARHERDGVAAIV